MSNTEDSELDPRIQIELENLNSATDEINKLEIELEEANSTFRILLNESTRRLKLLSKKLGSCIEKARPYYEALEKAREAQIECQKAAVKFQRANEIHIAAKETVALAEQRFMSNSHEWQFDNAWQEMLNHATQKVMDAEKQKAECHAEHQQRTKVFNAAEQKMQQLEERFRRSIAKSRAYFEEKQICQDQLQTQKNRIQELQLQVQQSKQTYSTALRNLERISDDIHRQRGDYPQMSAPPPGPREPGVGAELNSPVSSSTLPALPDFKLELEKCDYPSFAGSQLSLASNSTTHRSMDLLSNAAVVVPELEESITIGEQNVSQMVDENDLEALRQRVKILAVRPIEGGDGQQEQNDMWEHELNATVNKLDHLLLMKEQLKNQAFKNVRPDSLGAESKPTLNEVCQQQQQQQLDEDEHDVVVVLGKGPLIKISSSGINSLPATPEHHALADKLQPLKKLQKLEPPSSVNVSMRELPLLARLSNEILDRASISFSSNKQRRRSLE